MLMLTLIILVVAAFIAARVWFRPRSFGSAKGETERRHPERRHLDEDLVKRRKDDDVGGEGG